MNWKLRKAFTGNNTSDVQTINGYIAAGEDNDFSVEVSPVGKEYPAPLVVPRTNLVTQSEYFGIWTNVSSNPVDVVDNFAISPEGVQNAAKLTFNGLNSWKASPIVSVTQQTYTGSVYMRVEDGGGDISGWLSIYATGTGAVRQDVPFTITSEWQRFEAVFDSWTIGNAATYFVIRSNENGRSCLAYGAQLEAGDKATEYIPTNGAAVTRSWDSFSRVQNQVPGICNGTHTHTGAASGGGIAATTLTGTGSGGKFKYEFDTLGKLTLIEAMTHENLLLQSNTFDTTWSVFGSVMSSQAGYDGTNDASLLSKSASNGRVDQTLTASGLQTLSIYAKANTATWLKLQAYDGSLYRTTSFNLSGDGVIGTQYNLTDAKILSLGNGWYRCSIIFTGPTQKVYVYPAEGDNITSGTSGSIYIQDAQVEQGLVATEYIESGASTGKAGILEHSPRFDYSGGASCPSLLLEPSRTNLVEYSEYTGSDYWNKTGLDHTDNATISPEGVQNASLVTETIDNSQHLINIYYQNRPNVAAGSVTHSVRVKDNGIGTIILYNNGSSGGASAIFDISAGTKGAIGGSATSSDIKPLGNGWYEIYMTFTALAGNSSIAIYMRTQATYSGDGTSGIYIYGAQMEEGSYPTSYIPNHSGGSVTRGEETTSYLTLPETLTDDFTLFFDFKEINTVNGWIAFTDSSNVAVYTFYSYSGHFDVNNGSAYILESSADPNGKIALKQSGSSVKVFVNGVDKTKSGATANLTDIAKFRFASRDSRNSATLNQMLVFPEALSNTDCEILTGTSYESFAAMATALNYTTYE